MRILKHLLSSLYKDQLLLANLHSFSKRYASKNRPFVKRMIDTSMATKIRADALLFKLDTPEFKSIFNDEVNRIRDIFDKYNYEIRLAGGPVRDLLMGIQPTDLDFATVATPNEMKQMFENENIRMINVNGERHGTVTVRINDKENYEITTLRIDVSTNGRHAEVEFTSDWKLDANRRDLTINSMFLGFDGSVYDYFYGYDDLKSKRVMFVGDADKRIKEDYLRILRYFRFYGRIAETPNEHENETLECIKENASGLQIISGERIWVELKKILAGKYSGELLETMINLGIGDYIGLPKHPNITELRNVYNTEYGNKLHPITLLTSLFSNHDEALEMNKRLKLSCYDRDLTHFVIDYRNPAICEEPLLLYKKLLLHSKTKQEITREYISEVLKYRNNGILLEEFSNWKLPKFYYISVSTLNENGVTSPKLYGIVINQLKDLWAENDFNISYEDLVKKIPIIASNIKDSNNSIKNTKIKYYNKN